MLNRYRQVCRSRFALFYNLIIENLKKEMKNTVALLIDVRQRRDTLHLHTHVFHSLEIFAEI